MIRVIGIDPGLSGAIVILGPDGRDRPGIIRKLVMPTITTTRTVKGKDKKDNYTDGEWMFKLFNNEMRDCAFYVEKVHAAPGSSASSTFKMGHNIGCIHTAIRSIDKQVLEIRPKQWQSAVWIESDTVGEMVEYTRKKDGAKLQKFKVDTKATSLNAARRLFPGEDFLATKRSKKPHDGIVDAALIAYVGFQITKESK